MIVKPKKKGGAKLELGSAKDPLHPS